MPVDPVFITFLRHGRSRADDEGRLEGGYNSPLTLRGQEQSRLRARQWLEQQVQFDLAISSSLDRAVETASIVTGLLGVTFEMDSGWNEMTKGPLDGLTFAEANRRFPRPVFRGPFEPVAGIGESEIDLQYRISLALQRVIRRGPGRYLVVSHGGAINAALRVITGSSFPVNGAGVWFQLGNLGYAIARYYLGNHNWQIQEIQPGLE
jgi:2,3-bisphosphoglycerate-dependent phosphoglycerate mutase